MRSLSRPACPPDPARPAPPGAARAAATGPRRRRAGPARPARRRSPRSRCRRCGGSRCGPSPSAWPSSCSWPRCRPWRGWARTACSTAGAATSSTGRTRPPTRATGPSSTPPRPPSSSSGPRPTATSRRPPSWPSAWAGRAAPCSRSRSTPPSGCLSTRSTAWPRSPTPATTDAVRRPVEDRINVAIPTTIELDDERLASLVAPVAPLEVDNPDPVVLESGEQIDAGPISLQAEQLGPFLRARRQRRVRPGPPGARPGGVGGLARRHRLVGHGRLGRSGHHRHRALPAHPLGRGPGDRDPRRRGGPRPRGHRPRPTSSRWCRAEGFDEQVVDAVPYPRSPGAGAPLQPHSCSTGPSGDEIPRTLMHDLILRGAALTTLGNAVGVRPARTTTVEYTSEGWQPLAELAAQTLGGARGEPDGRSGGRGVRGRHRHHPRLGPPSTATRTDG